jgi:hypothetical protein
MCVSADRDTERASKTEISQLEHTLAINQQVLRLKISGNGEDDGDNDDNL